MPEKRAKFSAREGSSRRDSSRKQSIENCLSTGWIDFGSRAQCMGLQYADGHEVIAVYCSLGEKNLVFNFRVGGPILTCLLRVLVFTGVESACNCYRDQLQCPIEIRTGMDRPRRYRWFVLRTNFIWHALFSCV